MKLNQKMNETIQKIVEHTDILERLGNSLSDEFMAQTNGAIRVCSMAPNAPTLQLYWNKDAIDKEDLMVLLKDMADDADLNVRWDDAEATCYEFKIDRAPFCILVDKEA